MDGRPRSISSGGSIATAGRSHNVQIRAGYRIICESARRSLDALIIFTSGQSTMRTRPTLLGLHVYRIQPTTLVSSVAISADRTSATNQRNSSVVRKQVSRIVQILSTTL